MQPKRKLIKKQYSAPVDTPHDHPLLSTGDLLQQLKSPESSTKMDAIAAIANLQQLSHLSDLTQELYSVSTLVELLKMLDPALDAAIIETTLFAVNNLCVNGDGVEGVGRRGVVGRLFELGLDRCLLALGAKDDALIKPILVLLANMAECIPGKYTYLVQGIQATLLTQCEKYLRDSKYADLVMQFLIKSNYTVGEHQPQQAVQILSRIVEGDKLYRNRSMAAWLLVAMTQGAQKEVVDLFGGLLEEYLRDLDLEREYRNNIACLQAEEDEDEGEEGMGESGDIEEEEESLEDKAMMEEEKKMKNKKKKERKRKAKGKEMQTAMTTENKVQKQKQKQKQKQIEKQTPYTMFMDALEGLQLLLEMVVEQFEDQNNFEDNNQQEQQQQQSMQEDKADQQQPITNFNRQLFIQAIMRVLSSNLANFPKLSQLTFPQGQNILELILRLFLALPSPCPIPTPHIVELVQLILVHEYKCTLGQPNAIPEQLLVYNTRTSLQAVLKYKHILNKEIYVQLPQLKYGQARPIWKINQKWKQCWINLLQIYSIFYNPEKNPAVTLAQNRCIGAVLRKLIIEIPEIRLEEWRAQTIDTLFDVYSNQMYDGVFVEYGFMGILEQVLKNTGSGSGSVGKGSKKQSQFITAVVKDIQRFMAYKKQHIKF